MTSTNQQDRKRRCYIAGPMSGYVDHNFPAFKKAAKELRARGYDVISPHEIENDQNDWYQCMRDDIKQLVDCDTIYLLDGWWNSTGAKLECTIAYGLDMEIWFETK